jgi:hypothetical protein
VDKKVQVAEEPGQIHVPNPNQKIKVQKTECRYSKTKNHTITYYFYKHELFSGITLKKFDKKSPAPSNK